MNAWITINELVQTKNFNIANLQLVNTQQINLNRMSVRSSRKTDRLPADEDKNLISNLNTNNSLALSQTLGQKGQESPPKYFNSQELIDYKSANQQYERVQLKLNSLVINHRIERQDILELFEKMKIIRFMTKQFNDRKIFIRNKMKTLNYYNEKVLKLQQQIQMQKQAFQQKKLLLTRRKISISIKKKSIEKKISTEIDQMKKGINYMRKRLSFNDISRKISTIASQKRKSSLRIQTQHNIQYIPYHRQRPSISSIPQDYRQYQKFQQSPHAYDKKSINPQSTAKTIRQQQFRKIGEITQQSEQFHSKTESDLSIKQRNVKRSIRKKQRLNLDLELEQSEKYYQLFQSKQLKPPQVQRRAVNSNQSSIKIYVGQSSNENISDSFYKKSKQISIKYGQNRNKKVRIDSSLLYSNQSKNQPQIFKLCNLGDSVESNYTKSIKNQQDKSVSSKNKYSIPKKIDGISIMQQSSVSRFIYESMSLKDKSQLLGSSKTYPIKNRSQKEVLTKDNDFLNGESGLDEINLASQSFLAKQYTQNHQDERIKHRIGRRRSKLKTVRFM